MKPLFYCLFAFFLLGACNYLFATGPSLKLSPSSLYGKTISLNTSDKSAFHKVSDNAKFYAYFARNIDIYDMSSQSKIRTLYSDLVSFYNTKFVYIDDLDSTIYYSSGDSTNVYLVKHNIYNNDSDTLIVGPVYPSVLYYLSYDRKTVYSYQQGRKIQAIDLSSFSITYSKPALEYVQVNNFAVDENLKILHLGTFDKYLALDMTTMKEYYSSEYRGTNLADISVSPDGKTVVLVTNYLLWYGLTNAKVFDIPNKTLKHSLPDFASGTSAKFFNNDLIIFNTHSLYSCLYRIADSSIIYTNYYSSIIQPITYNGREALFCWETPNNISIKDPINNKNLKNYANTYTPRAVLGDTLIVENYGNLEYWNIRTNTKILDTLYRIGRITSNGKYALEFFNNKIIRRNLNNLATTHNVSYPFYTSDYWEIGYNDDGTKLFVAKEKCKDSTYEFDITTGKCLDTFSLIRDAYNWIPISSNTLKYYYNRYIATNPTTNYYSTIYNYKSNDTLLKIPQALLVKFAKDDRYLAVIDSLYNFYTIDLSTLEPTHKLKLPLNNSTALSIFTSDDNKYAYVYGNTLVDTTKSTVIWKIDIATSLITKTFIIENDANTKYYPTYLTNISADGKYFVCENSGSIYAYYFENSDSDAEVRMEKQTNQKFNIYPQPASEFITFRSDSGIIKSIKFFDNSGKVVLYTGSIGSELLEISTINMPKGVYHFSLETENSTETGNFVIN